MYSDLIYQLSLNRVSHIGAVHAKTLVQHFGSAEAIFRARQSDLEKIEGIGSIRARSIKTFRAFDHGVGEVEFIKRYQIRPLFLSDPGYPQRLLHCYDPPTILFYKGNADLNSSRILAIVGTRSNTSYGREFTEQLVRELAHAGILVASGLAFGIDTLAHRAAIKNNLPTIGVLGHGLDTIYPPENAGLAREMLRNGGLLTEFRSNTKPDKHNFPSRNRVVAGISDATVVVETGIKGGSMITAEVAFGYHRDVFAVPGRSIDPKSGGCNHLIKTNKAILLTSASEIIDVMGWADSKTKSTRRQRELFPDLEPDEKWVVDVIHEKGEISIDELTFRSELSSSRVANAILNLELKNVIESLPGKLYRLAK